MESCALRPITLPGRPNVYLPVTPNLVRLGSKLQGHFFITLQFQLSICYVIDKTVKSFPRRVSKKAFLLSYRVGCHCCGAQEVNYCSTLL